MGFFGSKKFSPKKSTMRRAQSLNSLKDPIQMQREFNPDPNNQSFKIGETTVKVKADGSLTTLYNEADHNVKEQNELLQKQVNRLVLERELLLDMLAEVTADYKMSQKYGPK
ncbi:Oidioi.mRNA.OKI2018_I69.chr2.g6676.t1.cds [Oikopleura dioica]|uniref:Oidioi.mRNA.OKI2018_I69.chr2.g6676.t1.cds n=1 Tax=Oikopleura dioica TaxID=34765 RepID=A0ABN7TAT2_OIKDI|nr:Oidioi.mRNA.OKI2018_I69.chr2.g6676.t1.cds [Oikopleura dioica]